MDANDRHVLAAALAADADILLTDNVRHFAREWVAARQIELLTSAQLLTRLADEFPDKMLAAHQQTVRFSRKPEADILATLERSDGPAAAAAIRAIAESSS